MAMFPTAVWGSSGKVAITAETEHALEAIRARGHRVGDSRQLAGVRDISVPVIGPAGDAIAVVTCPFLQRVDRKTPNEAGTLTELHRLAADISVD